MESGERGGGKGEDGKWIEGGGGGGGGREGVFPSC